MMALALAAYGKYSKQLGEANWALMKSNLSKRETYEQLMQIAYGFVCEVDKEIVGMVFLVLSGTTTKFFEAVWAHIRLLGVHGAHERKGVGRKLIELCMAHARDSGEATIALHTSEIQTGAKLYKGLGFARQKTLEKIYGTQYYLYTLQLNDSEAIKYHKATAADVPIIVEHRLQFAMELVGETAKEKFDKLSAQLSEYFVKATIDESCISIIAKCGGQVAGIGSVHIREMPGNLKNPSGKWGYIMNMYTVPAFRRRRVCKTILEHLEIEGIKLGVTAFELHATKEGAMVYGQSGFNIHEEPTFRKYITQ